MGGKAGLMLWGGSDLGIVGRRQRLEWRHGSHWRWGLIG